MARLINRNEKGSAGGGVHEFDGDARQMNPAEGWEVGASREEMVGEE